MRDNFDRLAAAGISVFGVNPASVAAHDKYVALFDFPFPLISDQERTLAAAFGALNAFGLGIQRSVFLVEDGQVRFAKAGAPSTNEILASRGN